MIKTRWLLIAWLVALSLSPATSPAGADGKTVRLRAAEVPVVVYIAPRRAQAASAGTLITLAAHAARMARETVIGVGLTRGASFAFVIAKALQARWRPAPEAGRGQGRPRGGQVATRGLSPAMWALTRWRFRVD